VGVFLQSPFGTRAETSVEGKNLSQSIVEPEPLPLLTMAFLGILVGMSAGAGAVLFRLMIGFFHNLFFLGRWSLVYNANTHTLPGPLGIIVIFVPVVGAVGVAFLVKNFAPEAGGSGVPEVMDAVYYNQGRIRPVVALVKSVASSLSIGSGGSIGREGPIIQIGSTFGSALGQILNMPTRQRVVLIGAGAGGGVAATFNTPIGGMAFAMELILPAVNASTLLPVVISTMTATYIGRYFLGLAPAFNILALQVPRYDLPYFISLPIFSVFGLFLGLLATLFIRSIYWAEDRFEAISASYYLRHFLGMFFVGIMIYLLMRYTGHYYVQGVGYATIEDILSHQLTGSFFLFLLVGLKLLATVLTLGSGASGGIFSPSLFMGAALGGAFGGWISLWLPHLGFEPPAFAVVGMAGMVAGTTGAVVTSITMLFEMTRDYSVILPLMLCVAITYAVRKHFSKANIYTLKLFRRGHIVPEGLQCVLDAARQAGHLMDRQFLVLPLDDARVGDPVAVEKKKPGELMVLARQGQVVGIAPLSIIREGLRIGDLEVLARKNFIIVPEDRNLPELLRTMDQAKAQFALVSREIGSRAVEDLLGIISNEQIARTAQSTAKLI
jgi:chloride channel protein, CIC family